MPRRLCLLLLLSAAAAQDTRELQRLLKSPNAHDRLAGVRMLAALDSGAAVAHLEAALRGALRDLDRLTPVLEKADKAWLKAWWKRKDLEKAGRRRTTEYRELDARVKLLQQERRGLANEMETHLEIVLEAGRGMGGMRSAGAAERLERGARGSTEPVARLFSIAALGQPGRERSLPALLAALGDEKDPRFRAALLRALVPSAGEPGVVEAARELAGDEAWAVRLGAYQVIACGPFAPAVEFLTAAVRREEGEIGLRIDAYLEALTGESFAQDTSLWQPWFRANAEEIRNGSYLPEPDPERAGNERKTVASFFRIPIDSTNLVFVIDFSGSMDKKSYLKDTTLGRMRARYELPETRLGYAKAELIRALNALPEGAYFNIVGYADEARALSRRRVRLTKFSRERAVAWLLRQEAEGETNLWDGLRTCFGDYLEGGGGARRFAQLPDTIVFLTDGKANRGRFRTSRALQGLVSLWNQPLDAVIHCVGFGRDQQRDLLDGLAKETGGFYVDLGRGDPVVTPHVRRLPAPLRKR